MTNGRIRMIRDRYIVVVLLRYQMGNDGTGLTVRLVFRSSFHLPQPKSEKRKGEALRRSLSASTGPAPAWGSYSHLQSCLSLLVLPIT